MPADIVPLYIFSDYWTWYANIYSALSLEVSRDCATCAFPIKFGVWAFAHVTMSVFTEIWGQLRWKNLVYNIWRLISFADISSTYFTMPDFPFKTFVPVECFLLLLDISTGNTHMISCLLIILTKNIVLYAYCSNVILQAKPLFDFQLLTTLADIRNYCSNVYLQTKLTK